MTEQDATAGSGSARRTFVSFVIEAQRFAVPITSVREIIRVPQLYAVPRAPSGLKGLCNLRGNMLPVLDLRLLLGRPAAEATDRTRILVAENGTPVGLVVDQIASVFSVEAREIEPADATGAGVAGEAISGAIRAGESGELVLLLDVAVLVARISPTGRAEEEGALRSRSPEPGTAAAGQRAAARQFVSFSAAGQEYACPIEEVEEIVRMPETIGFVPNLGREVIGVMSLRDRLLPLIGLRRVFGLSDAEPDDHSRIVVVRCGTASMGLVVDRVREVIGVAADLIDSIPAGLAAEAGIIRAVCRLEGGRRLVNVVSTETLFGRACGGPASAGTNRPEEETAMDAGKLAAAAASDTQCVVFRLDNEEFAFGIGSVLEIIRMPPSLAQVPGAAGHVLGLVNLRGSVLPVIDMRRRLGLPDIPHDDRQRIMVLSVGTARVGALVDAVTEVLRVPAAAMEDAPVAATGGRDGTIGKVLNLHERNRLIMRLEPGALIGQQDGLPGLAA